MKSIKEKIRERIKRLEAGFAFSAKDFLKEFRRYEVDVALSSLTREGIIRRVIPGIYDRPQWNALLGSEAAPDLYSVAEAIARKFCWRLLPSGNTALNHLGLSTQIPARLVFLSDGPTRQYSIGSRSMEFRHSSLHELVFRLPESALVVQALKALGKEHVDDNIKRILRKKYPPSVWKKIVSDTCNASAWIHEFIRQASAKEENDAKNH